MNGASTTGAKNSGTNIPVKNLKSPLKAGSFLINSVLIIDYDETTVRKLTRMISLNCKHVEWAKTTDIAEEKLKGQAFDLIIIENILPDMSGLEWLMSWRGQGLVSDAIVMTRSFDLDTAIYAMQAGVRDVLKKPLNVERTLKSLEQFSKLHLRPLAPRKYIPLSQAAAKTGLLGNSSVMRALRNKIELLAKQDDALLITGETGTGKESAARMLHALSERAAGPFISVACASLNPETAAAELFGFVAADGSIKDGLIMRANKGVLCLNRVNDLAPQVQGVLLQAIEEQVIRPVGSPQTRTISVRFIAAANATLSRATLEPDFYHRISALSLTMPRLSERVGDIRQLAESFMAQFAYDAKMPALEISEKSANLMAQYSWPGNVRELKNTVKKALLNQRFDTPFDGGTQGKKSLIKSHALDQVERFHIQDVLALTLGNRAEAARLLGISRKTIERKCAAWGVKP